MGHLEELEGRCGWEGYGGHLAESTLYQFPMVAVANRHKLSVLK
jgi:hypothetical protein